ncbi:MAG: hypothetical protein ACRDRD_14875, partial [Pseudonocardiaceae bacterium]
VRVRPFVRRGGWVILERGWWDVAIDQRRYRLRSSGWLLRALGHLLPRPDLVIVLRAPAQVLYSRKPELSTAEFERQLNDWTTVLPVRVRRAFIDAGRAPADVLDSVADAVRQHTLSPGRR